MITAEQHINEHEQDLAGGNRLMQALLIAAIAASALSMVFSVGTALASASDQPQSGAEVASGNQ